MLRFFRDRYRAEIEHSETESWDTQYRHLLESVKGTDEYNEALQIPHRARTGRIVDKPLKGVILLVKKAKISFLKFPMATVSRQCFLPKKP